MDGRGASVLVSSIALILNWNVSRTRWGTRSGLAATKDERADKAKIEMVENFIVVVCFALGRVDEGNIELWRREVLNTKIWEGSSGPRETISNTSQEWMTHPSKSNQPVYNPMRWAFKFPRNPTYTHLLRPNPYPHSLRRRDRF